MTDLDLKEPAPLDVAPVDAGAATAAPALPVDIEAQGLTKRFGEALVFEDLNFRIQRSEAVAIVGANGTGKSTLLRCLMGLIPLTDGKVSLLGQDVRSARGTQMRAIRARTGLISQKHNLVPRLSVLSNVIQGLLGKHPGVRHWSHVFAPEDSRTRAMAALEKVGLADFALRRADNLSGGQSQRVAIARALVGGPDVLIADEPCASLDPAAGEDVMDLFFRLAREDGVTMVFISHHIDHALTYGDRVLGLADNRLKLDTSAASLSANDLRGLYD
ncbi:MAG: ATP-binding cassette domain-containing protein [Pseudomonadota bacterium]